MKKILVIDDEPAVRRTVANALRQSGFEVLEADNGLAGLQQAREQLPDLVISDIMMSQVDGFGVLQSLRSQPATSGMPLILMTGVGDNEHMRLGMELGADDFLAKPISRKTLVEAVRARLERQQVFRDRAKENEALLLEILAATRDLVAVADAGTGRLSYLNRAGQRMLGIGEAEDIGKLRLEDFELGGQSGEPGNGPVPGGQTHAIRTGETVFRNRDGRHISAAKQVLTHYLPDGSAAFFSTVASDITERKGMEQALRESERRHRDLLDSQDDGVVIADAEQRFTFVNPAFGKILGLSAGELHGRNLRDFLDAEQNAVLSQQVKLRKLGRKTSYEIKVTTATGETRVVLVVGTPQMDPGGRFCGTFAVFRDITEHKRTEEKLRLQTSALAATANGMVITDCSGKILWVNPAFTRLTGYASSEAVGWTPAILNSGAHDRAFFQNLWNTVATGHVWQGEIINRRKDGTHYHEEMTITPVLDEGGKVRNFVAVKQDISRRKRDEEELRAREESFRALADNVPDAVARIDRNLRLVSGNRAFARDMGMESAQFLGKSVHELDLAATERWPNELRQVFQSGKPHSFEYQWTTPMGVAFRESRLVPEHSAGGEVEFVLAVTRDVTAEKQAEKARQLMELQLRQAQKLEAIGQLAAGIAHEINTPTQYVGDNTRFLKEAFETVVRLLRSHRELLVAATNQAVTPELLQQAGELLKESGVEYLCLEIPQALQETLEGVERVSKIVRAMKEFSHPGGREKSAANLNRAIESTATVARHEWKYVADLKLDLDASLPLVPCFVGEFNQVILNLVVNAAHAIGDVVQLRPGTKGVITIQTRREGAAAVVRVSDTGTGIAEDHRRRIFEPFFTTKEVGKGSGQGLTLVYTSVVKKHGGTVAFETEAGVGTTFILRLPIDLRNPTLETPATGPGKRA